MYGAFIFFGVIILGIAFVRIIRPKTMKYFTFLEIIKRIPLAITKYKWHMFFFAVIYFEKNYVDNLNDPIRYGLNLNFTHYLYYLEKPFIHLVQTGIYNPDSNFAVYFTYMVGSLYLVLYIFINYFSVIYFAIIDHRKLANTMVLNYIVIYLISIPFYLFIPVDVTGQVHPNMQTLLYDLSPWYHEFFISVDPFDNCMPSLHIAIPLGMLIFLLMERKRTKTNEYNRFIGLLVGIIIFFTFAIIYLGIHWYIDILGGVLIAFFGVYIIKRIEPGFWTKINTIETELRIYLTMVQPRKTTKMIHLRRILASFIDISMIAIPSLLIFGMPRSYMVPDERTLIFFFVMLFLYWTLMEYFLHTTLGKLLFGLKITDHLNTSKNDLPEKLLKVKNQMNSKREKRKVINSTRSLLAVMLDILLVFIPIFLGVSFVPALSGNTPIIFLISCALFFIYFFVTRILFNAGLGAIIARKSVSNIGSEYQRRYAHIMFHTKRTLYKTFTFLIVINAFAELMIKWIFKDKENDIHKVYRMKRKGTGQKNS